MVPRNLVYPSVIRMEEGETQVKNAVINTRSDQEGKRDIFFYGISRVPFSLLTQNLCIRAEPSASYSNIFSVYLQNLVCRKYMLA